MVIHHWWKSLLFHWSSRSQWLRTWHIRSGWWLGHPSEKYESQLGWLFPIYGKIKLMFQTTNQRFMIDIIRFMIDIAIDIRIPHGYFLSWWHQVIDIAETICFIPLIIFIIHDSPMIHPKKTHVSSLKTRYFSTKICGPRGRHANAWPTLTAWLRAKWNSRPLKHLAVSASRSDQGPLGVFQLGTWGLCPHIVSLEDFFREIISQSINLEDLFPIGSMYAIYGNIDHQYTPVLLAYIPYMDPMGFENIPSFGLGRFIFKPSHCTGISHPGCQHGNTQLMVACLPWGRSSYTLNKWPT